MIVICPTCAKRYMLDDTLLAPDGRQVRCVSCQEVWWQTSDSPLTASSPPFLGVPPVEQPSKVLPPPKKGSLWLGSVITLALILCLITSLVFGRGMVVGLWPKSERLYNLLGLQVNLPGAGLSISNPTSFITHDGPTEMVTVTGDVLNTSDQVRPIPPLIINLMGEPSKDAPDKGRVLDHWEHRLSESFLLPGEYIHFETVPRPKVEGSRYVFVDFKQ